MITTILMLPVCVCPWLLPPLCRRLGGGLSQEPRGLLALRHALLLWKLHLGRHHAGKQPHRLFPTQQPHPAGLSRMVRTSVWGCFWGENVWRSRRGCERCICCCRLMHFVKVPKVYYWSNLFSSSDCRRPIPSKYASSFPLILVVKENRFLKEQFRQILNNLCSNALILNTAHFANASTASDLH